MPNGLGLFTIGALPAAERAALGSMSAPGAGAHLTLAAISAVRGLAAADGRTLPGAAHSVPAAAAASSSGGAGALVAFGAGAILIALAWGASLRARPLRSGRTPTISAAP